MAHGWEFLSYGLPISTRLTGHQGPAARLAVGDENRLGLRQWVLPMESIRELRNNRGPSQYCLWRNLVDSLGIGDWAWLGLANPPDAPRLLVRTDSPLIMETAINWFPPDCGDLVIIDPPGAPTEWPVKDDEGNHYLCELAVTWADPNHWREVSL
jgi:hypothetical protein